MNHFSFKSNKTNITFSLFSYRLSHHSMPTSMVLGNPRPLHLRLISFKCWKQSQVFLLLRSRLTRYVQCLVYVITHLPRMTVAHFDFLYPICYFTIVPRKCQYKRMKHGITLKIATHNLVHKSCVINNVNIDGRYNFSLLNISNNAMIPIVHCSSMILLLVIQSHIFVCHLIQ